MGYLLVSNMCTSLLVSFLALCFVLVLFFVFSFSVQRKQIFLAATVYIVYTSFIFSAMHFNICDSTLYLDLDREKLFRRSGELFHYVNSYYNVHQACPIY